MQVTWRACNGSVTALRFKIHWLGVRFNIVISRGYVEGGKDVDANGQHGNGGGCHNECGSANRVKDPAT
jgi:hypothetical protein